MNVQQQWHALCKAFHIRDWETLEVLLDEFQERLNAGESPVISDEVSSAFNHAMAAAGVAFIRSHFSRTDEWPVVDLPHALPEDPSDAAEAAGTESDGAD